MTRPLVSCLALAPAFALVLCACDNAPSPPPPAPTPTAPASQPLAVPTPATSAPTEMVEGGDGAGKSSLQPVILEVIVKDGRKAKSFKGAFEIRDVNGNVVSKHKASKRASESLILSPGKYEVSVPERKFKKQIEVTWNPKEKQVIRLNVP